MNRLLTFSTDFSTDFSTGFDYRRSRSALVGTPSPDVTRHVSAFST
jgi:hypothetical protein